MGELVSIIMPSYNTADYISDSIKSVQAQTYPDWELIIVDDCSSDNSCEVINSFDDSRLVLLRNEVNSGAAISRNYALREAKGKWIAFLDSDDIWLPDKLEKQISFMEKNNYAFSYTNYKEISENGQPNGVLISGPKKITRIGFLKYCWPGCLTVMYDRNVIGEIQIEDIKKNNDYALWLKASKQADCYLLDEQLALYRRGRQGSVSSHSLWMMIGWHYKLFRQSEKKGVFSSLFLTLGNMIFGLYKKIKYVSKGA